MSEMFSGCKSLTSLDLSTFETNYTRNMYRMFYNTLKLETLDLSHFVSQYLSNSSYIFENIRDGIKNVTIIVDEDLFNVTYPKNSEKKKPFHLFDWF